MDQLSFLLKQLNLEHRRKHLLRTSPLKFEKTKRHTGLQFCEIQPYLLLLAGGSKIIAENNPGKVLEKDFWYKVESCLCKSKYFGFDFFFIF